MSGVVMLSLARLYAIQEGLSGLLSPYFNVALRAAKSITHLKPDTHLPIPSRMGQTRPPCAASRCYVAVILLVACRARKRPRAAAISNLHGRQHTCGSISVK